MSHTIESNPQPEGPEQWLEKARRVCELFYSDEQLADKLLALTQKPEFLDVFRSSALYHACIGSTILEDRPPLSEELQRRLVKFEAELKGLIAEADKKLEEQNPQI